MTASKSGSERLCAKRHSRGAPQQPRVFVQLFDFISVIEFCSFFLLSGMVVVGNAIHFEFIWVFPSCPSCPSLVPSCPLPCLVHCA
jgi:hypothetical protein